MTYEKKVGTRSRWALWACNDLKNSAHSKIVAGAYNNVLPWVPCKNISTYIDAELWPKLQYMKTSLTT